MSLGDQLFKLRVACENPVFVTYRSHSFQLRVVGKTRSILYTRASDACRTMDAHLDSLIYKNYID